MAGTTMHTIAMQLGTIAEPENLETALDSLMERLLENEDSSVFDSTIGAVLKSGFAEVEVSVLADDEESAQRVARRFLAGALSS